MRNAPPVFALAESLLADGTRLQIREATLADETMLFEIEAGAWPPAQRAPNTVLRARLSSGCCATLVASDGQRPVGFMMALRSTTEEQQRNHPWMYFARIAEQKRALAGNNNRVLYGLTLSVLPDAPRGTGSQLMSSMARFAQLLGCVRLQYVIRLPGLAAKVQEGISPEEYVEALKARRFEEASFGVATNAGGKPSELLSDYYWDPPSLNYGLLFKHVFIEEEKP